MKIKRDENEAIACERIQQRGSKLQQSVFLIDAEETSSAQIKGKKQVIRG